MSDDLFFKELIEVEKKTKLSENKKYIQHGRTTVYDHCVHVAYTSYLVGMKLGLKLNYKELIRGALLHDYFLYDWHIPCKSHRLHGYFHPKKALKNAEKHMILSPLEKNIILRHMFPLTIIPPRYKESILVCIVDKYCSGKEMLRKSNYGKCLVIRK